MYVDESGDSGLTGSPTRFFGLSGIVLHELRWHTYLEQLIAFRRVLRQRFGLKLREEFHAGPMLSKPGPVRRIRLHHRIEMIRLYADALAEMTDLNVINVLVDKQGKPANYDVFGMAWRALIQRYENTISYRNFRGPVNSDDRGLLICDHTDNKRVMSTKRQMRRFNPIPHSGSFGPGYRDLPLSAMAEDPVFRDSSNSYFIQSADLIAFLLYQSAAPNRHMRKYSGHNFFRRVNPILCTRASRSDPQGVVRL